jgi:hypothetical protein
MKMHIVAVRKLDMCIRKLVVITNTDRPTSNTFVIHTNNIVLHCYQFISLAMNLLETRIYRSFLICDCDSHLYISMCQRSALTQ